MFPGFNKDKMYLRSKNAPLLCDLSGEFILKIRNQVTGKNEFKGAYLFNPQNKVGDSREKAVINYYLYDNGVLNQKEKHSAKYPEMVDFLGIRANKKKKGKAKKKVKPRRK